MFRHLTCTAIFAVGLLGASVHAADDELGVLRAEVENGDVLNFLHGQMEVEKEKWGSGRLSEAAGSWWVLR